MKRGEISLLNTVRDDAENFRADLDLVEATPALRGLVESLRDSLARLTDVVHEQDETIRRLRRDVVRDTLTGALNRRGVERVLDRTLDYVSRRGAAVSLLYLDLDGFKSVNDQLGHAVGDEALRHTANVLTRTLRRSDVIGRLGGDEFVALLWRSNETQARQAARRVSDAFALYPFIVEEEPIALSASVGVARLARGDNVADVLERADRDMYRTKAKR